MKISLRKSCVSGVASCLLMAGSVGLVYPLVAADETGAEAVEGRLSEDSLGNLLKAMGLKPVKEQKRYDFNFKAVYEGEEWELSMSTVLSVNEDSVWVMAWLDPLPKSAAEVPRTALLRLLADNDQLGKGKFFAYIAGNRRFVLQRIIPNENLTTADFRAILLDLGTSVVQTYPHWSVSSWAGDQAAPAANATSETETPTQPSTDNKGEGGEQQAPAPRKTGATQSTFKDSKFNGVRRN